MREWYRDIVYGLALIFTVINTYLVWRGPQPSDPAPVQAAAETATRHPVAGLAVVAALFVFAGILNSAPLLRRLLPRKKESTENEPALTRLEIEQLKKGIENQKSAAASANARNRFLEEQLQEARKPKPDPLCEALKRIAADDANKLNDRVRQFSQRIEFHGRALEPYLEVITELWNGSVFDLVCIGEISGHAIYVENQLAIDPRIVYPSTVPFNLEHGGRITFTVRQYLSTEMARTIEAGRDRGIAIDFRNVMVRFEIFQLGGMPGQLFKWFGPRFILQDTQDAL